MLPTLLSSYDSDSFALVAQQQEFDRLENQTALESIDNRLWQSANLQPGMRVLDLGCGSGRLASHMARSLPQIQVLGIDPSATAIAQAQMVGSGLANLTWQQGAIEVLAASNISFDLVILRAVLQHLPKPIATLQQVRERLRPGGQVSLLDRDDRWLSFYPEPPAVAQLQQVMAQWQCSQGGDPQVGRKLGSYLQLAGFTNIQVTVETASSDLYGLATLLSWLSFGQPYEQFSPEIAALSAMARQQAAELVALPYAWAGLGLFIGRAFA
jgi:ubiquinone/menaquinone biosynthesis C-methylase UbiE